MQELRCIQGCPPPLAALEDDSGITVYFCAVCRGTFCPGAAAGRWLGCDVGALSVSVEEAAGLRCPAEGAALLALGLPSGPPAYRCSLCSGLFLTAGSLPQVRALRPRTLAPPRSVPSPPRSTPVLSAPPQLASLSTAPLSGERLGFDTPWVNLLAWPIAFVLSALFTLSTLGRLLLYPVQIQFHELGHAVFAWLSSRAALPLPFGFTFWREDKSLFTGVCMVFLLSVLGYRGLRERRKFAVALSGLLLALFVVLSLLVKPSTSLMLMLAGGIAGELMLSTLVLVAFFFPLPDRLRWDFFRYLVLLPAAGTWLAAARLWRDVKNGTRPLPMGSLLGTPGDGSGDLDRLIADHDFTPAALAGGYYALTGLTATVLVLTYGWFALHALAQLRVARASGSPRNE